MFAIFWRPALCGALLAVVTGCSAGATSPQAHSAAATSAPTSAARPAAAASQPAAQIQPSGEPEPLSLVEPVGADGWLGAELTEERPDRPGVLVKAVVPRSPAARGDLRSGDVIVSADGVTIPSVEAFIRWVREKPAGARIRLGVTRQDALRLLAIELGGVPSDDDLLRMRFVGLPAPRLEQLAPVQGPLPQSLSELHGQVIVVEFWASWCVACRALVSVLNGWERRYGDQGLSLIAISLESADDSRVAAHDLHIEYPVASDESLATARSFRGGAVPTLFVIDQSGTVRDVMVGYSTPRLIQLESLIARLIEHR